LFTIDSKSLDTNKLDEKVHIVKLHGSINYYLREDGRIVKLPVGLPGENPKDNFGQLLERMMVYP
jgi:hypothetical protein